MNNPYENLKKYEGKELNYKSEFCPLINQEYKTGKAKLLLLSKLEQYMEIKSEYNKITIVKIYNDDEIDLIEKRGKYLTHIENFLIIYLSQQAIKGNNYCILTNRNILEMATMVNNNYFRGMGNILPFLERFNVYINKKDIDLLGYDEEYYKLQKIDSDSRLFFSASYRLLKRIIYDCLKNIKDKDLIEYNKTFVCYKLYKLETGQTISETIECTEEMVSRIISVRNLSVKEFNDLHKGEYFLKNADSTYVLYPKQKNEFKEILNYNFKEEFAKEGYTNFSRAWKINLGSGVIFKQELENRKFNGYKLNNNIINKLLTSKDLEIIADKEKNNFISVFIKCHIDRCDGIS